MTETKRHWREHDLHRRLLRDVCSSDLERCEYIYADGVRLAVRINDVSSLSNFYWFHLDHLGGTHQVTRGDTGEVAVFVPESVDLEGH